MKPGTFHPDDWVLDFGSGPAGSFLDIAGFVPLAEYVAPARVVAADIRPPQWEPGAGNPCPLRVTASLPLPFRDSQFAACACINVLEHLPDPAFAVRELTRVARPGAPVFVAVPNGGAVSDRLYRAAGHFRGGTDHVQRFTRASLLALLADAGLEIANVTEKWEYYTWVKNRGGRAALTAMTHGIRKLWGEPGLYGWFVVARKPAE